MAVTTPMPCVYNDGGRAVAGFKGKARDCVTRSIAIATGRPYAAVHADIDALASKVRKTKRRRKASSAEKGVYRTVYQSYLSAIGWVWTPTMGIATGCKVHLCAQELPPGRLIVRTTKHLTAVIDGVCHDTHDPSRNGTRCVYGYWSKQ